MSCVLLPAILFNKQITGSASLSTVVHLGFPDDRSRKARLTIAR